MVSFLALALLPLLISGVISFIESSRAIEKNTRIFSTEIVKQVAKNIALQMAKIDADSEALVLSDRVQSILTRYSGDNAAEKARARADLTFVLLNAYGSFNYYNQKYFLDSDRHIIDAQVFPQLSEEVEQFVSKAPRLRGRPYWSTLDIASGQKSIVVLRDIYLKTNAKLVGSLFLGIHKNYFSDIFDDVDLGPDSEIHIVDALTGAVLVNMQSTARGAGSGVIDPNLLAEIGKADIDKDQVGFISYLASADRSAIKKGERSIATFLRIPRTSWLVVSTIPYRNLLAESRSVRTKIMLIGAACFAFAILLAYLISRSIASPMEHLIGTMKQAEMGNYAVTLTPEGNDELTVLAQKFNLMAHHIAGEHNLLEERVSQRTQELEQANQLLAALSLTDSLTGIANRRSFDSMLITEWIRATRTHTSLALMMFDVDYFKSYNDFYGHQDGDICLRRVAGLLQSHVRRASDLVARYGGEEFVMLVVDTATDNAMVMAENIRASLEALALPHIKSPIAAGCITTSIGVAVMIPNALQTPEMFVRSADKAMYRAKDQGRNRVALAGEEYTGIDDPERRSIA